MELEDILGEVGVFSSGLVLKADGEDQDHQLVEIATALVYCAAVIYKSQGGSKYAAQQFYTVADRLSTE